MDIGVNNVPFIVPLPVLAARFSAIVITGFIKPGPIAVDESVTKTNKDQDAKHISPFLSGSMPTSKRWHRRPKS